jgi:hypothetical protein
MRDENDRWRFNVASGIGRPERELRHYMVNGEMAWSDERKTLANSVKTISEARLF